MKSHVFMLYKNSFFIYCLYLFMLKDCVFWLPTIFLYSFLNSLHYQRWYKDKPLNNSRKYFIKCPFNVTTIMNSIPHAGSSLKYWNWECQYHMLHFQNFKCLSCILSLYVMIWISETFLTLFMNLSMNFRRFSLQKNNQKKKHQRNLPPKKDLIFNLK